MFTGIIQELGKITKIVEKSDGISLTISAKEILEGKKQGDSIAVNGACLTITKIENNSFSCDAITETLEKTNLVDLKESQEVNLESALKLNQGIDGHLVQGHIDCTGEVVTLVTEKDRTKLQIRFPEQISKFLAFKGSITINGVSLTISDLQNDNFSVDLIPLTLEKTNLSKLKSGNKVNLEIDLIARYLDRLLNNKEDEATFEFLKKRRLI